MKHGRDAIFVEHPQQRRVIGEVATCNAASLLDVFDPQSRQRRVVPLQDDDFGALVEQPFGKPAADESIGAGYKSDFAAPIGHADAPALTTALSHGGVPSAQSSLRTNASLNVSMQSQNPS